MTRQRYVNNKSIEPCEVPATKCIVIRDEDGYAMTLWLCEEHYASPLVRQLIEALWDDVEY